MRRPLNLVSALVAIAVAAIVSTTPAGAQDWPTRSVTIVVPFAAGGNTDMMARLGAAHLSARLGQPFVVENKPGAGGALATGTVAAAAADGYTILFSAAANLLLTPMIQKINFDPDKQLVPVTNVGTGTQMIGIKRSLPATNLPELVAHAKANPGKLNFAVAGTGNISHLAPVLLFKRAGTELVMVPARGEPQAISDVISGNSDLYFGNSSSWLPHINSDKVRLIAVGTARRIPAAPDIPAVAETYPGFVFQSWNGFSVPAGTPEAIVNKIRAEIAALAKSPLVSERLTKLGIVPGGLSKDEVAEMFKTDRENLAAAVAAAGMKPQ